MIYQLRAYSKDEILEREKRIVGPFIIGTTFQALLFGILAAQYWWIITRARRRPSKGLHWFLAFIVLLSTAQCGCDIAMLWQVVVDFVGQADQKKNFSGRATLPSAWLYSIIQASCTCFFARRCFIATGRSVWSGCIMFLLIGVFLCMAVVTAVKNTLVFTKGGGFTDIRRYHAATMCLNAFGDLAISGILIHKISKEDLLQYREIVNRILVFALTTASLTTILGLVQAIVLLTTYATSSAWVAISLVLPRISTICVFTSVIARDRLAESVTEATVSEVMGRFERQNSDSIGSEATTRKPSDGSIESPTTYCPRTLSAC